MAGATEPVVKLKKKWVSAKTLGKLVDIRAQTISVWGQTGRIPSKIIGGRLRRYDLEGTLKVLGLDED